MPSPYQTALLGYTLRKAYPEFCSEGYKKKALQKRIKICLYAFFLRFYELDKNFGEGVEQINPPPPPGYSLDAKIAYFSLAVLLHFKGLYLGISPVCRRGGGMGGI